MSDHSRNWSAWIEKAEHDLTATAILQSGDSVAWDIVAFHAQQPWHPAIRTPRTSQRKRTR